MVVTAEDPDQVAAAVAEVPRAATGRQSRARTAGAGSRSSSTRAGSAAAEQAVSDLRAALDGFDETYVGGAEAEAIDEADAGPATAVW